jgi:geranylgeranyl diphosphate synthase type II
VPQTATHARNATAVRDAVVEEIETDLARRLAALDGPQALLEAIRYAVLGGGKRLRPVLTLFSCEAVGGRRDDARAAAGALELVHTFSLVHDDLPAMDDDELRRGRPTLHVYAGEAMAVLTGDVLLPLAFEWITEAGMSNGTTSRLVRELARASAHMITGQVYDTLGGFPPRRTAGERLDLIHRNKTAALLRAACRMGAICGSASQEQLGALTAYGEAVGVMFQIVDDLLDVTQTAEHIGKATGKDTQAGKLTYPGVHGTKASKLEVERLRRRAHDALEPLGEAARPLVELCDYMAVRTK